MECEEICVPISKFCKGSYDKKLLAYVSEQGIVSQSKKVKQQSKFLFIKS